MLFGCKLYYIEAFEMLLRVVGHGAAVRFRRQQFACILNLVNKR
jgi:hypothetical protein